MTQRTVLVVTAGLTQPSSSRMLAERLAEAAREALLERDLKPEIELVELRNHAHDVINTLVSRVPTGKLRDVLERVVECDGLIAVTPVFNASYNGLFKSFFDVVEPDSLENKPVLMGATGGTPRHSLVLDHAIRPMFSYLRAIVAPTGVYAASEDWGAGGAGAKPLMERITRAAAEFADLLAYRPPVEKNDPFTNPVPFEDLLGK